MPLQVLSLGCEIDAWRPRTGAVHSVFERAVNLLLDGELWTVLRAKHADAPFGIRLAPSDGGFAAKAGECVHVRAGFVGVGKMILDCRTAPRWTPTLWTQRASGLESRLATLERAARPRAWAESVGMARDVVEALSGSDAELAFAVRRTVGRGPGLTPAGDDVLVGMLSVLTSESAKSAGARAASRLTNALMPAIHTTADVSRHLLHQAARGLPGRALHDLGRALIEGASHEALAEALDLVLNTGCTSGADACLGLAAACDFLFLNTESLAA
jgi:hypothetical protein